VDIKQLVQDQAKWAEEVQDWRAAAEMYSASGNLLKAVEIMGQRGWYDDLMDIVQKLDASISSDTKILGLCADFFLQAEKFKLARDVFLKIGDFDALLKMHIRLQDWEEAVRLATKHKDRVKNAVELWVPYAEWLTGQDRFDDALEAYTKAKRMDHCSRLLKQLIENAVFEKRFKDASYYHWRLAEQLLVSISTAACESKENDLTDAERKTIEEAKQNELYSELYYAYAMVFSFTDEPFTTLLPESLFHASRFLLNKLTKNVPTPPGMSLRNIYYTLGQHAVQLESYKLARQAFEKLLPMKLRPEWQSVVELTSMTLQTKPYADREDLLPVDYRSSTVNPLLNPNNNGDVCVTSGHPFVRSFVSFENLPLVEFQPAPGISDEKAEKLILAHPSTFQADGKSKNSGSRSESKGWKEVEEKGGAQTLRFDDNDNGDEFEEDDGSSRNKSGSSGKNGVDLFEAALNRQANYVGGAGHRSQIAEYKVLQIDEKTLASLNPNDIFIVKYPTKALRYKFYKNMIPEIKVHFSPHCRRFFHEEDFEFEYLKTGVCPCCRLPEMDTPENNPTTTATNTQNSSNKKSNPINKGDLNNNHQP
jgi:intraflagellar transport protein 122